MSKISGISTSNRLIDENRIGLVRIPKDLVLKGNHKELLNVFGKLIVVKCEYLFAYNCFEYTAFSPLFEKSPKYSIAPEYKIIIDSEKETVTAERVKNNGM